jgi:hypothetical protein
MALRKSNTDPVTATIAIPAATYVRLKDLADKQHRTPEDLITLLIRTYVGDLTPAERRPELVHRSEDVRITDAYRGDEAHTPLDAMANIGAELFSTAEDEEFLLRFIELGVIDDGR